VALSPVEDGKKKRELGTCLPFPREISGGGGGYSPSERKGTGKKEKAPQVHRKKGPKRERRRWSSFIGKWKGKMGDGWTALAFRRSVKRGFY